MTNVYRSLQNSEIEPSMSLSYKGLLAVIILIFYTLASPIFAKLKFTFLHESGICMIVGALVALITKYASNFVSEFAYFDEDLFFNLILPPIIFSAGYNLKKRAFFQYLSYIISFGVFGTLLSFGTVATLIYYSNKWSFFNFKIDEKMILLFSSVIASTDTVAAMTFIKENEQPKLFSVLFGEGVLNDAVCIVLYRIILMFDFSEKGTFNFWTILYIIAKFSSMFLFSCLLGIGGGLVCSYVLKILKKFGLNRVQQTSLIIFFAFTTYNVTELMGYSPIISLLFCGIFMSHYAFYNLTFQAREESSVVSKILANIAEGFVFAYLGFSSVSTSYQSFSFWFTFVVFIYVILGRFVSICGISAILNKICGSCFNFSFSEQGISFFAGCIRGAIAFGLANTLPSSKTPTNDAKKMLVSSTLVLVFFSTVLFGALMARVVKFFSENKGKNEEGTKNRNKENIGDENNRNFEMGIGNEMSNYSLQGFDGETLTIGDSFSNIQQKSQYSRIHGFWRCIDDRFLRPLFIDDWQTAKEEHNQIAKEIMQIFENHEKNKMKQKILQRFNNTALIPESRRKLSKNEENGAQSD